MTPSPSRFLPWLVAGLCFLVLAVAYSGRATLGLVMPTIETDLGWSRTFLSGAAAATLVVMAAIAPFAGRMVDRDGPRFVLVLGITIIGVGAIAVALSSGRLLFLLAFSLLFAVGQGIAAMHVVSTSVAHVFKERVGLAIGFATSGSTAGQILFVPLIAALLVVANWRWCFAAVGIACLILAPILWRLLPGAKQDPALRAGRGERRAALGRDLRHILRQPAFHILFWSFFVCGYTTTGVIETHFLPFASFCGFGPVPSATAFGILSAVNLAGMVFVGWLTDRMNRPLLLGLIYIVRGLSFLILINVGADYTVLVLFAILFGTVDYSTVPVTASLVETHVGLPVMGLTMGMVSAGHSIGAALGAFLGGLLFDLYAQYQWVWLSSLALAVLAGLMVFTIRDRSPLLRAEAPA